MTPDHSESISVRTVRGMFWSYGSYVGGKALVLVSTALLARLLTPADFGLVALALVFVAFTETFSDIGLTQALIIADEDQVEERARSVWTVSVGVGAALAVILAALGPLASDLFDEHELVLIMPALGLNLLVRSLGTTHYALAQKRLDFRSRTVAEFADVVVRAAGGIALALAGAGVWSIVIGYLIGTMAMNVALWRLVPWRPAFRFVWGDLRGLISFGGAVTFVGLLGAAMGSLDDLIVGSVLGTTALGFYNLAYRIPDLLIVNLSNVAGRVLFPAMASLSRDALPSAFLTALRYGLIISMPLAVGLAVLAEPVVLAMFGEKWRQTAATMQVMVFWTLMSPSTIIIGTAYKAMGRADILLKIAIPQAAVLVAAILLSVDSGIVAVAACQAVVALVFSIVALAIATRMLRVSVGALWKALWPVVVSVTGMAAVLIPIERALSEPWPALLCGITAGAVVYGLLLWLLARETILSLVTAIGSGRRFGGLRQARPPA